MATPIATPMATNELSIPGSLGAQAQFVQDEENRPSSLALTATADGGNVGIGAKKPLSRLSISNVTAQSPTPNQEIGN